MKKIKNRLITSTLCFTLCCVIFFGSFPLNCFAQSGAIFEPLVYPEETITEFKEEKLGRVSTGPDYISNRGYDENGLYMSPYWSCEISEKNVPVYAVMSYNEDINRGVLQSVVTVFVKDFSDGIDITLTSEKSRVNSAVILPEKLGVRPSCKDNTVFFTVNKAGAYTCLINGDSLDDAVTVFVKEYTDENAEIESYINRYGEDRVKIYPTGFYETEYIDTTDCDVIYFCRGSYISAKHIYDVRSDEEAAALPYRNIFLDIVSKDGFVIDGAGTIDFNRLDRNERSLMSVADCKNCSFSGLTFINPPVWTVTVHSTSETAINNFTIFGYRTNSDGINICGCKNMKITNCFARNGDDCYSVKTLNTDSTAENIIFENCIGWSNKCRCFGITGEVYASVKNITFRNCDVLYRNADWDNNKVSSLAVAVEMGGASVENVLFEDISIYRDDGRAFYCTINNDIENCRLSGIVFRNISYNSSVKSKIATRQSYNGFEEKFNSFIYRVLRFFFPKYEDSFSHLIPGNNDIEIRLENVVANGRKLNPFNMVFNIETKGNENISF